MKILYIVDFDFWNSSKGIHTRFNNIYEQFGQFEPYVFYSGSLKKEDKIKIKNKYNAKFYSVYPWKRRLISIVRILLKKLHLPIPKRLYNPIHQSFLLKRKVNKIVAKNKIDIIWCYYIWNYDMASIKTNVYKVLDTQDIASEIVQNKIENHLFFPSKIILKEECEILNTFDMTIAISKRDEQIYKTELKDKVFYLPFYFPTKNIYEEHKENITLGFIGGDADFNIIALRRLLVDILPYTKSNYKLIVFGKVCNSFSSNEYPNVEFAGLVDQVEDAYKRMDISINPVTMGSGLKTKCIEAMSFGIPLITTNIGAQGIEDGANEAYILADKNEDLIEAIDKIVLNPSERKRLSENGIHYINTYFGDDKYKNLIQILKEKVN